MPQANKIAIAEGNRVRAYGPNDEVFLSADTSLDFLLAGCQTELEDIVDQLSIPSAVTVGAIVSVLQFIREYCEEKNYTLTPEGIAHLDTYIKKYIESM